VSVQREDPALFLGATCAVQKVFSQLALQSGWGGGGSSRWHQCDQKWAFNTYKSEM